MNPKRGPGECNHNWNRISPLRWNIPFHICHTPTNCLGFCKPGMWIWMCLLCWCCCPGPTVLRSRRKSFGKSTQSFCRNTKSATGRTSRRVSGCAERRWSFKCRQVERHNELGSCFRILMILVLILRMCGLWDIVIKVFLLGWSVEIFNADRTFEVHWNYPAAVWQHTDPLSSTSSTALLCEHT